MGHKNYKKMGYVVLVEMGQILDKTNDFTALTNCIRGSNLILSKCLPILMYGLHDCPLKKSDIILSSIDFS